jgi:hypothetical protein
MACCRPETAAACALFFLSPGCSKVVSWDLAGRGLVWDSDVGRESLTSTRKLIWKVNSLSMNPQQPQLLMVRTGQRSVFVV